MRLLCWLGFVLSSIMTRGPTPPLPPFADEHHNDRCLTSQSGLLMMPMQSLMGFWRIVRHSSRARIADEHPVQWKSCPYSDQGSRASLADQRDGDIRQFGRQSTRLRPKSVTEWPQCPRACGRRTPNCAIARSGHRGCKSAWKHVSWPIRRARHRYPASGYALRCEPEERLRIIEGKYPQRQLLAAWNHAFRWPFFPGAGNFREYLGFA